VVHVSALVVQLHAVLPPTRRSSCVMMMGGRMWDGTRARTLWRRSNKKHCREARQTSVGWSGFRYKCGVAISCPPCFHAAEIAFQRIDVLSQKPVLDNPLLRVPEWLCELAWRVRPDFLGDKGVFQTRKCA
jgi:hypothetical protein